MFILGLTGSIGMGKSATAQMFKDINIPVHDADATVHKLMAVGGKATDLISKTFVGSVRNGAVDRQALGKIVFENDVALKQLEGILHPLVREEEREFLRLCQLENEPLVVLDIPLLFETQGEDRMDAVAVVSAPEAVQRKRVLERPSMDEVRFNAILKKQMPDSLKRKKADFIINTGAGFRVAQDQVKMIVSNIKKAKT